MLVICRWKSLQYVTVRRDQVEAVDSVIWSVLRLILKPEGGM